MAFTAAQRGALNQKLDAAHLRTRRQDGRDLAYLEGWHVIAEANRIFGYHGWDRITEELVGLFDRVSAGETHCGYRARVRVQVRAGRTLVTRVGHGVGRSLHRDPGEAHARALKEAETDATKRALVTFGNVFGLALYDPARRAVTGFPDPGHHARAVSWPLMLGGRAAGVVRGSGGLVRRLSPAARGLCVPRRAGAPAATEPGHP